MTMNWLFHFRLFIHCWCATHQKCLSESSPWCHDGIHDGISWM